MKFLTCDVVRDAPTGDSVPSISRSRLDGGTWSSTDVEFQLLESSRQRSHKPCPQYRDRATMSAADDRANYTHCWFDIEDSFSAGIGAQGPVVEHDLVKNGGMTPASVPTVA